MLVKYIYIYTMPRMRIGYEKWVNARKKVEEELMLVKLMMIGKVAFGMKASITCLAAYHFLSLFS